MVRIVTQNYEKYLFHSQATLAEFEPVESSNIRLSGHSKPWKSGFHQGLRSKTVDVEDAARLRGFRPLLIPDERRVPDDGKALLDSISMAGNGFSR